eukprot:3574492-Pyramimonas_sp.AAC.2
MARVISRAMSRITVTGVTQMLRVLHTCHGPRTCTSSSMTVTPPCSRNASRGGKRAEVNASRRRRSFSNSDTTASIAVLPASTCVPLACRLQTQCYSVLLKCDSVLPVLPYSRVHVRATRLPGRGGHAGVTQMSRGARRRHLIGS